MDEFYKALAALLARNGSGFNDAEVNESGDGVYVEHDGERYEIKAEQF